MHFTDRTIENLGTGRADTLEDAALLAVKDSYPSFTREQTQLRFARAKLKQPDIQAALEGVYAAAGLSLPEMLDLHVKHIRGDLVKESVTASGEIVQVKMAPSYAALKDALKMVLPQPAVRVQADHRHLHGIVGPSLDEPAPIAARPLPRGTE